MLGVTQITLSVRSDLICDREWATDVFARILVAHTALCGFSFGTRYLPTSRSGALIHSRWKKAIGKSIRRK